MWSLPETATRVTPKLSNPWQTPALRSRTQQSRAGRTSGGYVPNLRVATVPIVTVIGGSLAA